MMINKNGKGLPLLFTLQLLLVAGTMFVDVKLGIASLGLVLLFGIIILMRRIDDKQTDLAPSKNIMLLLYLVWGVYCFAEIANPNSVQEAWNISIAHYFVYPVIFAIIVPLSIRNMKGIETLLLIWSIFLLIAFFKGYWQKSHGFSQRDFIFLYEQGGYSTHIIWSGIRYFSCLGNAANYGIHSAMAATAFGISFFYIKNNWLKFYFIIIILTSLYGIGISGTRAAVAVPISGVALFILLSRNWKGFSIGFIVLISFFTFFRFTTIGESNEYIRKMRTAFNPTEDASYQVRIQNREGMKKLMADKPFGYGMGLSKSERFNPNEKMPYAPDSWLVSVWVETGIIGLVLYLVIHAVLFAWCSWILMFQIMNKRLRGLLAAWLCMNAGFFVAAYANDVMQYPCIILVCTGFALCIAGPYIDKNITKSKEIPV